MTQPKRIGDAGQACRVRGYLPSTLVTGLIRRDGKVMLAFEPHNQWPYQSRLWMDADRVTVIPKGITE
jgi:hypothetical protein